MKFSLKIQFFWKKYPFFYPIFSHFLLIFAVFLRIKLKLDPCNFHREQSISCRISWFPQIAAPFAISKKPENSHLIFTAIFDEKCQKKGQKMPKMRFFGFFQKNRFFHFFKNFQKLLIFSLKNFFQKWNLLLFSMKFASFQPKNTPKKGVKMG